MRLKIHVVLDDEPTEPLLISVKRDATVEEVIGYALYEHLQEEREPAVPDELKDVVMWNMRIAEDDGTVDDDFPGKGICGTITGGKCILMAWMGYSVGTDTEDPEIC